MLSSACYAYKDGHCEESWYVHSVEVVKCIASRWEFEGLSMKASRLARVDPSIVRDLILIAGLLHDIAKVDELYQRGCVGSGICTYFPKHWIRSALASLELAYRVEVLSPNEFYRRFFALLLRDEDPKDVGDLYVLLVVIPILLHSYAHICEESLFGASGPIVFREIVIYDGCVDCIARAIDDVMNKYVVSNVCRKLLNELKRIAVEERSIGVAVINERDLRNALLKLSYGKNKVLAEAALGILNLCDGQVAYRNRKCGAVIHGK